MWKPQCPGCGSSSLRSVCCQQLWKALQGCCCHRGHLQLALTALKSSKLPIEAKYRCGCFWCYSSLGPWRGNGVLCSPWEQENLYFPLRSMGPQRVWLCASIIWIFGATGHAAVHWEQTNCCTWNLCPSRSSSIVIGLCLGPQLPLLWDGFSTRLLWFSVHTDHWPTHC